MCNNCVRQRHTCPGYGDVFDCAHRSQNHVVRQSTRSQRAAADGEHAGVGETPSKTKPPVEPVPTTSPGTMATDDLKVSQRGIVSSANSRHHRSIRQGPDLPKDCSPDVVQDKVPDRNYNTFSSPVPCALKQNAQDASICFFFRHYGGTSIDPEVHDGFNQMWQPMYLQAPARSSVRPATAAVTVSIAMMWFARGCDTRPASIVFTEAVAAAQEALKDPLQCLRDETLMKILLFDLYDTLALHYSPVPIDYGKHKHSALAMIEHRGFANFATPRARALIATVRHTVLPYMLSTRQRFPERLDHLFGHPSTNATRAMSLDLISVPLTRVQSRLWTLRRESHLQKSLLAHRTCYEEIIVEALEIEGLLLNWKASITDPDWLPEYVRSESVVASIRESGFYGSRCSIRVDLTFAGIWILFSVRYLLTLQVIRQSFADEPSLLRDPEQRALLIRTDERVQGLVDFICETIPFHLGDTIQPKSPIYSVSTNFPAKCKVDPKTGRSIRMPSLRSNHQARAAASGRWILFPHLVNVWRLAEPEDDAVPIVLREDQLDWIKEQIRRLQRISLFCEPVWF